MVGRCEDSDRCVRWLGHTLTPNRGVLKAIPTSGMAFLRTESIDAESIDAESEDLLSK